MSVHLLRQKTRIGKKQRLAQLLWVVFAAMQIGFFAAGLPGYYETIQEPCLVEACVSGQLTLGGIHALGAQGVRIQDYALLNLLITLFIGVVAIIFSLIIFIRRSDGWFPLFTSLFLLILSGFGPTEYLMREYPELRAPGNWLGFFSAIGVPLLFSAFPNGKFIPHWMVIPTLLWGLAMIGEYRYPMSMIDVARYGEVATGIFFTANLGLFLYAQIFRYRRVSNAVERQQTKWVLFGFMAGLGIFIFQNLFMLLVPQARAAGSVYRAYMSLLDNLFLLFLILGIGIAILRFRLWDIDILIKRTLVYGAATILLTLVYLGSVVVFETLIRLVTGQSSDLAVIVSTLGIAALFRPVLARSQDFIDHRFYRKKYDAEQALAAFHTMVREEVDLDRLTEEVIGIVQKTMQPASVNLYLRPVQKNGDMSSLE